MCDPWILNEKKILLKENKRIEQEKVLCYGKIDGEYELKNKCILKYFGENHQYKKFLEEIKEMTKELESFYSYSVLDIINNLDLRFRLSIQDDIDQLVGLLKWETNRYGEENSRFKEGLLSEIADCQVLAHQLNEFKFLKDYIYLFTKQEYIFIKSLSEDSIQQLITKIMQFKIDRTIERYNIDIKKILEVD